MWMDLGVVYFCFHFILFFLSFCLFYTVRWFVTLELSKWEPPLQGCVARTGIRRTHRELTVHTIIHPVGSCSQSDQVDCLLCPSSGSCVLDWSPDAFDTYIIIISRESNQNGVSPLYIMLEIHHSGREPSIYMSVWLCVCVCACVCVCVCVCVCAAHESNQPTVVSVGPLAWELPRTVPHWLKKCVDLSWCLLCLFCHVNLTMIRPLYVFFVCLCFNCFPCVLIVIHVF